MRYIFSLFMSLMFFGICVGQEARPVVCHYTDEAGRSRDHNVDMQHMLLEVSFLPEEGLVMGNVKYRFEPIQKSVDSLFLDGPDIRIKSVKLNNSSVRHRSYEKGVAIYFSPPLRWEQKHELEIAYEANPRKGIYFIGWNDPKNLSRKQIWTQGQGTDNRHWIPSYDFQNDKLTTETIIHFSRAYEVVSNGNLEEVEDRGDGTLTWRYQMTKPHSSYLVMLAIGKYDYKEMTAKNGIATRQYFYPDRPETVDITYKYSNEMMDYLEKEFGVPYPWETYANVPVQDFLYGAMENTTATIFTDYYVQDERAALERNYIGTNAHELVHQWFGDYITAWSGHDHWLHESFATHYAKTFRRQVEGEDRYQLIRKFERDQAISAGKKNSLPIVHSKAGGSRHYPKGSLVIDMIKYVLGKEEFDRSLTHFLEQNPYGLVVTDDLRIAILEKVGVNLDWFFDQWLYKGGEPHYEVKYAAEKGKVIFYVDQVHETSETVGYFKMPIIFQVHLANGQKLEVKEWVYGPSDTIAIQNPNKVKIDFVLFDPNRQILKNVTFDRSQDELVAQALSARNMIDRYDALIAMRDTEAKKKRDELIAIYNKETFTYNKQEILKQLANDNHKDSRQLMKRGLADNDHYVRRAVLEKMEEIPKDLLADFERLLTDRSYENIEKALTKLCEQYPGNKDRYLLITAEEDGMSKNIRVTWLRIAAADNREKHFSELAEYASQSYEFRTRINAMEAIRDLGYCDDGVLDNLCDAILSPNRRLAGPGKKTLRHFRDMEEYGPLVEAFYESKEWSDWQKEILAKLFVPEDENSQ